MPILRRFGAKILVTTILVFLAVFLLVSLSEGFKFLVDRKEGIALRKRDGMTITFSLPWKGPQDAQPTEVKALSPVLDDLLGDFTNVAAAILESGSNVANDVSSQGDALQSKAAVDSLTQISVVFDGGAAVVASIMSEVNSIVNDATGIIGGVVGDATSGVGMIFEGVTRTSTTNVNTASTSGSTTSSEPQEFLPQSQSSTLLPTNLTSAATLPVTSAATLPPNSSPSSSPAGEAWPTIATTTITPCCPPASTVTCTVTETWHSTHYESTQTLYSFMSTFTVTCSETVTVLPPPNPYLFLQNNTTPSSSNSTSVACANGVLAKRSEECPPLSTPQESDCSMMGLATSSYTGSAIPSVASLMSSVGTNAILSSALSTSSGPSPMTNFPASVPSLPSTMSPVISVASLISSIICADGTLVIRTQDCLDGLSGAASSSLLAFGVSPAPILSQVPAAVTNPAGNVNTMLSNMVANVVSALSNVEGLTGDLLSTVMSDVASALSVANTLTGSVLPTSGVFAVAGPGGAAAAATGNFVLTLGGAAASADNGGGLLMK